MAGRPAPYRLPTRAAANNNVIITEIIKAAVPKATLHGKRHLHNCMNHPATSLLSPEEYLSSMMYTVGLSAPTIGKIWHVDGNGNARKHPTAIARAGTLEKRDMGINICGYALVAHLVKEITNDNMIYIHKRFMAIGEEIKDGTFTVLTPLEFEALIKLPLLQVCKANLLRLGVIKDILEDILSWTPTTELQRSIQSSLKMILRCYGMTATENMKYFCTIVTKAHLYELVLDECVKFKDAYDLFVADYPEELWTFGRVLKLPGVENLDNTKYPHLYVCAMAKSRGVTTVQAATGGLRGKFGNYKQSNMANLKESLHVLEIASLTTLSGDIRITNTIKDKILALNGTDLTAQIGQAIP